MGVVRGGCARGVVRFVRVRKSIVRGDVRGGCAQDWDPIALHKAKALCASSTGFVRFVHVCTFLRRTKLCFVHDFLLVDFLKCKI